ncbi:anti-sigma factor family protein [Nocardioides pyridinolyticus]
MTCDLAQLDGAYVLGALAPEERLAFERHLPTCPACSAAVRDLAGLPGLLGQVSPEVVRSPPEPEPVPETLLPALVAEVRREQHQLHRRRWVAGLVAAAAVVVIGLGAALAVTRDGQPAPEPPEPPVAVQPMVPIDQDAVEASVALTSVAWGTRLDLTCSYDVPSAGHSYEPPVYSLVVRTADGTEQVATWKGLPGRTMHLTGATALTTDEILSVEVQDADGRPLLELTG